LANGFSNSPLVALQALLAGVLLWPQAASPRSWSAVDALRTRLEESGVRVVQDDCRRLPQVLGLYHRPSDRIVICRVHGDSAAVWDTLAHEATHRMQACWGGSITRPEEQNRMAAALSRNYPQELNSLRAYPASKRLAELEARYTAKLPPDQVIGLFDRYCG
jgi:hypothetical protein